MKEKIDLTILFPCLNEEKTIGACILKAKEQLDKHNIKGEIIVIDNGSTDNSIEIAKSYNVKIVHEKQKGYGSTLRKGHKHANGKYILFADSDNTYDLNDINIFYEKIKDGYDLVVGNRFLKKMDPKAMPFLNKYIGNPFLSSVGKILFKTPIGDFHCGIRIYRKKVFDKHKLTSKGMEYASEMIAVASKSKLKMAEIPTTLKYNNIKRKPHLKPIRDGLRHLNLLFKIKYR